MKNKPLLLAMIMIIVVAVPFSIGATPDKLSLEDVYDLLGEVHDIVIDTNAKLMQFPVEKTGQTETYATGDDGDLEKGLAWPNPRFTDNADGTVTDNLTGLIWLKNANCFGPKYWYDALVDSNSLADGNCGLTDESVAGDWRLPNTKELQSLIDHGQYNPALSSSYPFTGVQSSETYWTSTSCSYNQNSACVVDLYSGDMSTMGLKGFNYYVWPVRGEGVSCLGDFDSDGDVDGSNLAVFAADFGRTDCPTSD